MIYINLISDILQALDFPASVSFNSSCFVPFQVGVFPQPAPCDGTSVLQQLARPCADLLNHRVVTEEGAGLHQVCGNLSSGGRGSGAPMSTGRNHKDGVQGHSLDVPLGRGENIKHELQKQDAAIHFIIVCFITCFICLPLISLSHRFRLSEQQ